MKVWLVTVGEPLPTDGEAPRLLRAGILFRMLAAAGHDVTWWTSAFDHQSKRFRTTLSEVLPVSGNQRLILLHGREYRRNVSLQRIRNHREIAAEFVRLSEGQAQPDVVLCSYPTIELSIEATNYGRAKRVPVVLDVRDLWPDSFLDIAPAALRPLLRLPLASMFRDGRRALAQADAIWGVTDAFVEWGLGRAGRGRQPRDQAFAMAYEPDRSETAGRASPGLRAAEADWDRLGATVNRRIICFFGVFGRQFDFDTVIRAADIARKSDPRLLWVLCGNGDSYEKIKGLGATVDSVLMPGWVDRPAIAALMRRSIAGLAPYRPFLNFQLNLPNKPVEYLSAGLPVITSVDGVIKHEIVDKGAGLWAPGGDPHALAEAALLLAADDVQRSAMAARARALFGEAFSADVVYGRMISALEALGRGHAG